MDIAVERVFQKFCYTQKAKFRKPVNSLNEIQLKVLACVRNGMTVAEICKKFELRDHTVRNHIHRIRLSGVQITLTRKRQ